MSAKDVFGLILRLTGMGFVIFGILDAMGVVATLSGFQTGYGSRYPVETMALAMAMYLATGLFLLVAAKPITNLVYGRD
jgi:hypothetical protein